MVDTCAKFFFLAQVHVMLIRLMDFQAEITSYLVGSGHGQMRFVIACACPCKYGLRCGQLLSHFRALTRSLFTNHVSRYNVIT